MDADFIKTTATIIAAVMSTAAFSYTFVKDRRARKNETAISLVGVRETSEKLTKINTDIKNLLTKLQSLRTPEPIFLAHDTDRDKAFAKRKESIKTAHETANKFQFISKEEIQSVAHVGDRVSALIFKGHKHVEIARTELKSALDATTTNQQRNRLAISIENLEIAAKAFTATVNISKKYITKVQR